LNYVSIIKGIGFSNVILLTLGGNLTIGGAKVGCYIGEQHAFNLIVDFFQKLRKTLEEIFFIATICL
jgi:hypothetical protein